MIRLWELERIGAQVVAMSDRSDGNCSGAEKSMDARRTFIASCGACSDDTVCVTQVHGATVVRAREEDRGNAANRPAGNIAEADALITDVRGLPLGVSVADCVPVWIVAENGIAGGMVHAGRAGTRQNIAGATVNALRDAYGVSPGALHAWIGPSAGPHCYEVDEATAEDFVKAGGVARGRCLDLWATNCNQLADAGVPRTQIGIVGYCTICGGRFHSYRAHKTTARNLALLVL
jgi:hypothetical protein